MPRLTSMRLQAPGRPPARPCGPGLDQRRLQGRPVFFVREGQVERRAHTPHRRTQVDQDRLHLGEHDVEALAIERREGVAHGDNGEARARQRHLEDVALATVEELRRVLDLHRRDRHSLMCEQGPALGRLVRHDAVGLGRVDLFERLMQGAHEVVAHVGEHAAERGRDAGEARHQHVRHAEFAGDGGGVHGPGAAEGEEGEVARVVPLVHRDEPRGTRHLMVHHAEDRGPGRRLVETERLADLLANDPAHLLDVGRAVEAADGARIDAAEQQIGVGHRGLPPAPAVADRPGCGGRARACRGSRAW